MSEEMWQAILLGVIQGIAEFLPISSKGHLLLTQELLKQYTGRTLGEPMQMVVALHLGTLLSIFVVYWKDLKRLLTQWRLCGLIVLATIPVGLVGITVKDIFEQVFQVPIYTGFGLLVTAAMLWFSEKWEGRIERPTESLPQMSVGQALLIGTFQAFALCPGISRSGSTISGGLISGLRREDAARFSFFIAIPAISAATVLVLKDVFTEEHARQSIPALLVGAVTSFVVGVVSLSWLIRLIVRKRLHWFAYYCVVVGLLTIAWQLMAMRGT